MAEHTYKLMYFEARGAAELSRLVFKAAGAEFIDERISRDNWPNRKEEMPLKAMPVLEVDGKKYCQSSAIARYLAKKFGLMGSSVEDEFRIDELHETMNEMVNREIMKIYYEKDEAKKKEIIEEFAKGAWLRYLDFFEMRLKENHNGTSFYVGNKLSLGDLIIFNGVEMISGFIPGAKDALLARPSVKALCAKVEGNPNIAAWLKSRPQTAT